MSGGTPPALWRRILRWVVRGEERERVEDALGELYAWKTSQGTSGSADAWYRRQVVAFVIRAPALRLRGGWLGGGGLGDGLRLDLGFAMRQNARRPAFAWLAVLTMGLGIGAATAIFALVDAVVLEPLPYPEPERLVAVVELTPDGRDFTTSEPNAHDFRERNRSLSGLAAFQFSEVAIRLGGEPVQLRALRGSADFFGVLGGRAALGRVLTANDAEAGSAPAAVLSQRLWRDGFGGDAAVLGREILLDGRSHTVVGVMPAGWQPFGRTDVWLPEPLNPSAERDEHSLNAVGRLAPGQTIATARTDLGIIQRDLGASHPESNGGWGVDVRPLKQSVVGAETVRAGWVLLGAVALLLLLSCASVSNLLIARATTRRREMALRVALGASAGRVVRQLLTESVVLALAGAAAGVLLALAAVPVLQALSPPDTPRLETVRVDGFVLLFAACVSIATGMLSGVAPAVHALGADVRGALATTGRTATEGHERLRGVLVVGQVAVAFALVVGVGVLAASWLRLQAEDSGLAVDELWAVPLTLSWERYDLEGRTRLLRETEQRIGALPGVLGAGFVNIAPFGDWDTMIDLSVDGIDYAEADAPFARWRTVTPGYAGAAGVRILAGRALEAGDAGPGEGERAAAVVTLAMAERVWGSADAALGRRFAMSRNSRNWMRVVGVAADVEDKVLAEARTPLFFFLGGGWWPTMTLIVRAPVDAALLAPAIRRAIGEVDAALPVPTVEPVARRLARSAAAPRFRVVLMIVFGTIALTLAVMGVYGVTHLAVSRRTREIGIRLALGAEVGHVIRLVLARSSAIALTGIVLGAALAAAGARAMQALLFRTSALDPLIMASAAAIVMSAALCAAWMPARRATHVDPTSVMRAD